MLQVKESKDYYNEDMDAIYSWDSFFFFLKQIELLEAASLNYNSNNKEKIHLY